MGTKQHNDKTGGRGIEWCDETRNATGGCMHGCKWEMPDGTTAICYAEDTAERGAAATAYPHGFAHHYWRETGLKQLANGNDPLLIFCDSMSDMFAANVPSDQVKMILAKMRDGAHHTYQSLTKAAPQLLKYADDMPPNLWVGVSSPPDWFMGNRLTIQQQHAMLKKSLEVLREIKQRTQCLVWMSAEPVSWDLCDVLDDTHPLDWIVIGAASSGKKYFQPRPEHIKSLLQLMDATTTPVFFKGNIGPLFRENDLGSDALHRWREDFPATGRDGMTIPAVARRQSLCIKHGWTLNTFSNPVAFDTRLVATAKKGQGELW